MKKIVISALLLALASGAASAQTDLGVAQGFNAFLFGNLITTNGGESEGPIAVGGNWTAGTYNVNIKKTPTTVGSDTNIGAYIKGNVNVVGSPQVYDNAYVDGAVAGTLQFQDGGSLHNGVNSSIFNQAAYVSQSNYLGGLNDQAINTSDPNNINIDLNNATKYGNLKVFSISASDLGNPRTLNIANFGSAYTLLINVTGGNIPHFGLQVNGGNFNRILWNDSTATAITIDNRLLEGSLLAPNADITQSNVIEGNLIANSLTVPNGNELHFGAGKQFNGTLLGSAAVPEPGTLALLAGIGISGAGFLIRRKRA